MSFAVLVDLIFEHFLFGNIVGHHALCSAFRGKFGEIPVFAALSHIVLFEHINEFGEGRRYPYARFVFHALNALRERFFDDERKVVAFLLALCFAQIHEHRDERRLSVRGEQGHDLILNGLDPLLDLGAQTFFGDLRNALFVADARARQFFTHVGTDFFTADIDERRKMRQRYALSAVLIRGDLCDDLRCDIARRGKGMRLFDIGTRNHRSVLQHVFKVDKIAVVHMLREIIGVVKMNETFVVRFHDVEGQKNTARDVFGNFARHIIALHGIDRGIFVGIFLFDLFVVAFDKREDLRVGRVGFTHERTGITVGNIFARDGERLFAHDLIFDEVLNFFDADGAVQIARERFHAGNDVFDLLFAQTVVLADLFICLADRIVDLCNVELHLRPVSFDNFHNSPHLIFCLSYVKNVFRKKGNAPIILCPRGFVKGLSTIF